MISAVGKPSEKGHSRRAWKECQLVQFPGCTIIKRKCGSPATQASHKMRHTLQEIYTGTQGGFGRGAPARGIAMGKNWKQHKSIN